MTDQLNEAARLWNDRYLASVRESLRKDKQLRDTASDLLAALQGMMQQFESRVDDEADLDCFVTARAVIAKAMGE